ncbi:MAG: acetyl-CoA C-acyltransferase [Rhodanobacteraceae bacterium]
MHSGGADPVSRTAVIVSTARTPLTKAGRGEFNITPGPTLASFAVRAAIERAGVEGGAIDDLVLGCGYPEGHSGRNIARQTAIRAGLPASVPGVTVSRFCASGLQAIAQAAAHIVMDGANVVVAGGVESISGITTRSDPTYGTDPWIREHKPDLYMAMIDTADVVARRYGIRREAQDRFSVESQRRTAEAQQAGRYREEIVACTTTMALRDKKTKAMIGQTEVTIDHDTCNRPDTTFEALAKLPPVKGPDQFITAGNASQLSDGASACVLMEAGEASRRGLEPLGAFRGFAVAGCEPDEMGIGPIYAVPKLLQRNGLKLDDIDLWELNEAFASQSLYCIDQLHLPIERLNVDGGAISIGHPFGMTGARLVGHLLIEGRRRKIKRAVATMCVAGGMGAAGLLEIY